MRISGIVMCEDTDSQHEDMESGGFLGGFGQQRGGIWNVWKTSD